MNCPNCKKEIPASLIAKAFAAIGGRKGKRKITPDQQLKMQEGRERARQRKHNNY